MLARKKSKIKQHEQKRPEVKLDAMHIMRSWPFWYHKQCVCGWWAKMGGDGLRKTRSKLYATLGIEWTTIKKWTKTKRTGSTLVTGRLSNGWSSMWRMGSICFFAISSDEGKMGCGLIMCVCVWGRCDFVFFLCIINIGYVGWCIVSCIVATNNQIRNIVL